MRKYIVFILQRFLVCTFLVLFDSSPSRPSTSCPLVFPSPASRHMSLVNLISALHCLCANWSLFLSAITCPPFPCVCVWWRGLNSDHFSEPVSWLLQCCVDLTRGVSVVSRYYRNESFTTIFYTWATSVSDDALGVIVVPVGCIAERKRLHIVIALILDVTGWMCWVGDMRSAGTRIPVWSCKCS